MVKLSADALRRAGLSDDQIVKVMLEHERTESTNERELAAARARTYRDNVNAERHGRESDENATVNDELPLGLPSLPLKRGRPRLKRERGTAFPFPEELAECPPAWRAMVARPDQEIAYAWARFREWALSYGILMVRWDAAWRNCAGPAGWAFDRTRNGASRYAARYPAAENRRQGLNEALGQLAPDVRPDRTTAHRSGNGSVPGNHPPAAGSVPRSHPGGQSGDLFDQRSDRDDPLSD